MPQTMHYVRSVTGLGVATFTYASGMVASLELTSRVSGNTGFEHYEIVSDTGRRIRIENNLRLTYHQGPPPAPGQGYGAQPDYYSGAPGEVSATWEPEFSLGQLYNKGLFIQGFYHEVQEFAQAILEKRSASAGTLEQARQVTRVFEAFAEGPGRTIELM
jgi:predicted dehydrogenase